jgi:hypothetical protein
MVRDEEGHVVAGARTHKKVVGRERERERRPLRVALPAPGRAVGGGGARHTYNTRRARIPPRDRSDTHGRIEDVCLGRETGPFFFAPRPAKKRGGETAAPQKRRRRPAVSPSTPPSFFCICFDARAKGAASTHITDTTHTPPIPPRASRKGANTHPTVLPTQRARRDKPRGSLSGGALSVFSNRSRELSRAPAPAPPPPLLLPAAHARPYARWTHARGCARGSPADQEGRSKGACLVAT